MRDSRRATLPGLSPRTALRWLVIQITGQCSSTWRRLCTLPANWFAAAMAYEEGLQRNPHQFEALFAAAVLGGFHCQHESRGGATAAPVVPRARSRRRVGYAGICVPRTPRLRLGRRALRTRPGESRRKTRELATSSNCRSWWSAMCVRPRSTWKSLSSQHRNSRKLRAPSPIYALYVGHARVTNRAA